jgi:hypothetical protein
MLMRKTWLASMFAVVLVLALTPTKAQAQSAAPQAVPSPWPSSAIPDCPEVARAMRDLIARDARMRDWPNLTRYQMANDEVKRAGMPVSVVFLGDSITDAWDDEDPAGSFRARAT